MQRVMILRFRDLVTDEGDTIVEHRRIIQRYGEVWWGWWSRKGETPPMTFFEDLSSTIERNGPVPTYLFDSDSLRFYTAQTAQIRVAPMGSKLSTPDPERSPSYYHPGKYPAWFRFLSLDEVHFPDLRLYYDSFPTRPHLGETLTPILNQPIPSLEQLRHMDATLLVAQVR